MLMILPALLVQKQPSLSLLDLAWDSYSFKTLKNFSFNFNKMIQDF